MSKRRKGVRYSNFRAKMLARDQYRCRHCLVHQDDLQEPLTIHHVLTWSEAPHLRFEPTNVLTLCRACHDYEHIHEAPPPKPKVKGPVVKLSRYVRQDMGHCPKCRLWLAVVKEYGAHWCSLCSSCILEVRSVKVKR